MKAKIYNIAKIRQNKITDIYLSILLIILSAVAFAVCIAQGMGNDIWYDEVFSVNFLKYHYDEIVALTAEDVHPPFYYWYLKAFHDIGKLIMPGVASEVLAKMASLLPMAGIWAYAFTLVRKRMGILVASLFIFLISTMPQLSGYAVEIRMYSLALFCITALFLHSYEIILENKLRHWITFWIYGIVTAYIQYYACVGVVAVYIAMFVFFLMTKKKQQMIYIAICACISVVAYLPWIPSLIAQITNVSNSYWIQPLTIRSIFGCMKFVFLPVFYASVKKYVLAVMMIAAFGFAYCFALVKEKNKEGRYLILTGVFIPVFIAFTGFVASALNRPIFVYRYLIPGLGAMWLVAAYVLLKYRREMIMLLMLIPFLLGGQSNMESFYADEQIKTENMEMTNILLEEFPEDAVVLCNFNHVQAIAAHYLDNDIVLYGGTPESLIAKMLPNCKEMPDVLQIQQLVQKNDVYFFGSFNAREELLKEWEQYGIAYTEEGTYLLERYWFNVYHLKYEGE